MLLTMIRMLRHTAFLLLLCAACILAAAPLAAKEYRGDDLMLLGSSASAIGRGAAAVAGAGVDLFDMNPASVADYRRIAVSAQFGSLDSSFSEPRFSAALPTDYGVIGASASFLAIPAGEGNVESGYTGSFGGARRFGNNLSLGFAFSAASVSAPEASAYFYGALFGGIYTVPVMFEVGRGFGFYAPSIGFSVTGGTVAGDDPERLRYGRSALGFSLPFYRSPMLAASLHHETACIHDFADVTTRSGIELAVADTFLVRAGAIAPAYSGGAMATGGIGVRLTAFDVAAELNYAAVYSSETSFAHYAGLTLACVAPDTRAPSVSITPNVTAFSPDGDGIFDAVVFGLDVSDEDRISGWRFQILSADRILSETYYTKRMVRRFSPLRAVASVWENRQARIVPDRLLWDGRDGAGMEAGNDRYRYSFIAWDEHDNISSSREGFITIDNVPALAEVSMPKRDPKIAVPGEIAIRQKVRPARFDRWQGGFMNEKGSFVREFHWEADAVPAGFSWDGLKENGDPAPDGNYTYCLSGFDSEGNVIERRVTNIVIDRGANPLAVSCGTEFFSYGSGHTIRFSVRAPRMSDVKEWKIVIREGGDAVHEIPFTVLPSAVEWDGYNRHSERLRDGRYSCALRAEHADGRISESIKSYFIIDSTPPEIRLGHSPGLFSPDGDGTDDLLTFRPRVSDLTPLTEWKMEMIAPGGAVFRTWKGTGAPPREFIWNGRGDGGKFVESLQRYRVRMSARDSAGNRAETWVDEVPVDILVLPACRGFRIRLDARFAENSDRPEPGFASDLKRLSRVLNWYRDYTVRIEAHTDDRGDDHQNLVLSESRAKFVAEFLESRDSASRHISFTGMGETAPFLPAADPLSAVRNNRIEVYLNPGEPSL